MRCLSLWMMMDGVTGTHTQKKRETDEMTDEMIERDNLVMDQAQEIDNLRKELERVKGIAFRRLDRIAQLQHQLAVVEDKLDKLENTRSDLEALADLRASAFRSADAMQYIVNYCR